MPYGGPPDGEVGALQRRIAALEAAIVERQAEVVDLRADLAAIQGPYEAQVGVWARRLEEVEAEIARCRATLRRYAQWGRQGPPAGQDGAPYVSAGEQYRRTWVDPPPASQSVPPPPAAGGAIRELYRTLCRRYHPDLTQDEGERSWRTEVMVAVNAAYAARDLARLQSLAVQPGRVRGRQRRAAPMGAAALAGRVAHLERTLRGIEDEIARLERDPLIELSVDVKLAAARGRDLLAEMADAAAAEWAEKRAVLADLQAELRLRGWEE
jgi:hypothetical protein